MNENLVKRFFGEALVAALMGFILQLVISNLIFLREDWFSYSIMFSMMFAISRFIISCIKSLHFSEDTKLLLICLIALIVLFIEVFVFRFIIKDPQWNETIIEMMTPFCIGLLMYYHLGQTED